MITQVTNISKINVWEIISILPELYLITMSLWALIVIGLSNYHPAATKIEKKMYVMPTVYAMSVNSLWYTIIIYIINMIISFLSYSAEVGEATTWQIFVASNVETVVIAYSNYILSDFYTTIIKISVLLTIILIMNTSKASFEKHPRHLIEYPIVFLLTSIFLLILISAYNLMTVFLAIVGFSVTIYILLLTNSFNTATREAGIKYFYLSTVSTGLLLCGICIAYFLFHTTSFLGISWTVYNWKVAGILNRHDYLITLMLSLIIFGLLFKLAAFPCHLWAAEVYEGSPNAVTVLFVLPIKIATFAIFIRILGHTFGDLYQYWHYILWFSAMFSMIWGAIGALFEKSIKRFMAYSSINQMGFLLMGVSCGTFEGYRSALIYLFLYVLMNAGFFVLFLCTKEKTSNRSLTYLTDLNDFAKRNSMFSFALVIVFFSMAGIPPLGGFFGKYFIFLENLNSGHTGLVIIGMLTSVIATYYYLRIIKLMLFEKTTDKRFIFQVHMSKPLKEVYIQIIFVLIAFVLATPWLFSIFNTLTLISIQPLNGLYTLWS